MMKATTRRAGWVVAGITFIGAGLMQGHTAYVGVGAAFFVIGLAIGVKTPREQEKK